MARIEKLEELGVVIEVLPTPDVPAVRVLCYRMAEAVQTEIEKLGMTALVTKMFAG